MDKASLTEATLVSLESPDEQARTLLERGARSSAKRLQRAAVPALERLRDLAARVA